MCARATRWASLLLAALLAACGGESASGPATSSVPPAEDVGREEPVIHRSSLAGTWYEADPARLRTTVQGFLDEAASETSTTVRALVLPHAGYRWSGGIAGQGVRTVLGRTFGRVVVMGPSHRSALLNTIALPAATHFATPLGEIPLDVAFLRALEKDPVFRRVPEAHDGEHSVEIELPLLQQALPGLRLVPLVVGDLDRDAAARAATTLLGLVDDQTLVVVSSDFTHYGRRFGYVPFEADVPASLERLDKGAVEPIERLDADAFVDYVDRTEATICGRRPIEVLVRMLPPGAKVRLVGYDTSGRIGGDWETSVSYVALAIEHEGWPRATGPAVPDTSPTVSEEDGRRLHALARDAIVWFLERGHEPEPQDVAFAPTPGLARPAGAFVTLRRGEELRGCIGQIEPRAALWRTVLRTAIGAAAYDRRFLPVTREELDELSITVSVLTPPRSVGSWREIELGRHGIVLEKDGRTATFLPQVATEMGWSLEQTLTHLARKAGLPEDAWREGASWRVFEAQQIGDPER